MKSDRALQGHRVAAAAASAREIFRITDWRIPIYVKIGATRTYFEVMLAAKAGADAIVLDGMEGGTAATQQCSSNT